MLRNINLHIHERKNKFIFTSTHYNHIIYFICILQVVFQIKYKMYYLFMQYITENVPAIFKVLVLYNKTVQY